MGYKPEVHEKAVNLYGYQGDKRNQKAHIVIPRKQVGNASNDVGFERVNNGFILHASEFDWQWRKGKIIETLNTTYGENKLKKIVRSMSNLHITNRNKLENGNIEIELRYID